MNMRTAEYTNPPSPPKNDEIHHPDHYTWKGTEVPDQQWMEQTEIPF